MDNTVAVQQFERYLQRRFAGRSTAVHYISDLRQFEKVCQKPWGEVTAADIEAFVEYGRAAEWKATTVRRRLATLKTFFEFWAVETGEMERVNPVQPERQAPKVGRRLPRDLSDEAVERLWVEITEPRDQAWFVLMLRSGLRVGEVVGLNRGDILRAADGMEPARLRVLGKGQKERVVYLSADGYAVVARWLDKLPAEAETPVCPNARGERMTVSGVQERLGQYAQRAGLHATCHQLRHTYARQMVEHGMPVTTLAKLLGHECLSTTGVYILGADPEVRRAYMQAMQNWDRGRLFPVVKGTAAPAGQGQPGQDEAAAGIASPVAPTGDEPAAAVEASPVAPTGEKPAAAVAANPVVPPQNEAAALIVASPVVPTTENDAAVAALTGQVLPAIDGAGAAAVVGPTGAPLPPLPARAASERADVAETWARELPEWVREGCLQYVHGQARNWKASQQRRHSLRRLQALKQFWTWQLERRPIQTWSELTRADLQAYVDASQAKRHAPSTVKNVLYPVWGVLRQQQARGAAIPESVFRVELPKDRDVLPRHLNEEEAARLEGHMQTYLDQDPWEARREAAWYYVLAHTGLRLNELIDLRYGDLDVGGARLRIEQAKGLRDRVVYLDPTAQRALERYLAVLPPQAAEAPLFYRTGTSPLGYRWVQERLHQLGEEAGVKGVSPHRLRHTLATQLLNQGVPITTLQPLLGHEDLNTTQRYARVSDPTVEQDYRQAMSSIEHRAGALRFAPVTLEAAGLASPVTLSEAVGAKLPLDNSM